MSSAAAKSLASTGLYWLMPSVTGARYPPVSSVRSTPLYKLFDVVEDDTLTHVISQSVVLAMEPDVAQCAPMYVFPTPPK